MSETDVDRLAFRLLQLAGRPDALWAALSDYEREGWRHIIRELLKEIDLDIAAPV